MQKIKTLKQPYITITKPILQNKISGIRITLFHAGDKESFSHIFLPCFSTQPASRLPGGPRRYDCCREGGKAKFYVLLTNGYEYYSLSIYKVF